MYKHHLKILIIDKFGFERVWAVLANIVQQLDWDGRISSANKTWAKGFVLPEDDRREYRITQCSPGLVDLVCNEVRRIQKEMQQEKKPSLLKKLSEPMPKPAVPVKKKSRGTER